MYNYEIILYWSNDDEAFIAEVPELPGCMADGKTRKEAVENAEQIIQEWQAYVCLIKVIDSINDSVKSILQRKLINLGYGSNIKPLR